MIYAVRSPSSRRPTPPAARRFGKASAMTFPALTPGPQPRGRRTLTQVWGFLDPDFVLWPCCGCAVVVLWLWCTCGGALAVLLSGRLAVDRDTQHPPSTLQTCPFLALRIFTWCCRWPKQHTQKRPTCFGTTVPRCPLKFNSETQPKST